MPFVDVTLVPVRTADWPARLAALVAQRLPSPFVWGKCDCATFVADAAVALWGFDRLAELRVPRRNRFQALRRIQAGGGFGAALQRAGFVPVPPALAQRGDVVLLVADERLTLALCNGADALAQGPDGLVSASMQHAVAAWRG